MLNEKQKIFDYESAYKSLTSKLLTHEQKLMQLAKATENAFDIIDLPDQTRHFLETGAINDLFEGHAPYRPRYIMPDYAKFVNEGSAFLNIKPPQNFDELIFALMIIYRHVPSITNFPVYLGNLDELINPFIDDLSDIEVVNKLKLFFTYLDRTITDSFSHANLGPVATRAGYLILQAEKELQNSVPNFTLKYDPQICSDDFAEKAIDCSLHCSNPAITNYQVNLAAYGEEYGISSCYNILPTRGGAFTLARVTLTWLAKEATSIDHFVDCLLPECLRCLGDYMNERIRFLVEESGFFESNFLVKEGLIDKNRFVGMLGITGLAEAVNWLLSDRKLTYGRDEEANQLADRIMAKVKSVTTAMPALYSPLYHDRFVLHAQVGLESDIGVTSGVRIPVGGEPESFIEHLRHSGRYHRYFPAGAGDIFPIATEVDQNLGSLLDVVKGAFAAGVHYLSFYAGNSDLVRITGYLVKRSEMEKYRNNEVVLQNTTHLGAPNYEDNRLAERKVRMA